MTAAHWPLARGFYAPGPHGGGPAGTLSPAGASCRGCVEIISDKCGCGLVHRAKAVPPSA